MNYFLLLLALVAAVVALLYTANIIRVAAGRLTWASNTAFIVHLIVSPASIVLAIWIFRAAVNA